MNPVALSMDSVVVGRSARMRAVFDFLRVIGLLAADLHDEGLEAIVVIHRPAVERMVVALRALKAHSHEYLGDIFRNLQRVALDLIVIGGRIRKRAAVGGEEFLHDLVERHIL